MADEEGAISGITQLQMLGTEVAILEKSLKAVNAAEKTSSACARVLQIMKAAEEKDGFLVKEGGAVEQNQYHTSAGQGGDDGCCVVL
jgi:prefoldin subunit 5